MQAQTLGGLELEVLDETIQKKNQVVWLHIECDFTTGTQQLDSDYRLQRTSRAFTLTNGFFVIKGCRFV